jgi:hypothetical protein
VNGTTSFVLTEMERSSTTRLPRLSDSASRRPTHRGRLREGRRGEDTILATVAFVQVLRRRRLCGARRVAPEGVAAAREMGMVVRLVGAATLVDGRWSVSGRSSSGATRSPPSARSTVMLQGDAIREITLEAWRRRTRPPRPWSHMVTIVGTTGTAFLRTTRAGERSSVCEGEVLSFLRAGGGRRPPGGRARRVELAAHGSRSRASSSGREDSHVARRHPRTPAGAGRGAGRDGPPRRDARRRVGAVVSDRGVAELGWA